MEVTKEKRLGQEKHDRHGILMKVVEYNNSHNVIVEFEDGHKTRVKTNWINFKKGTVLNPNYFCHSRIGEERHNNKGYLMKIIEYQNRSNIVVEFQDKYKGVVHTSYQMFVSGAIRNPYHPSVFGVGITGNKYLGSSKNNDRKEYATWNGMLERCFDQKYKELHPSYKNVTCCEEWLLYENFYDWLHSQSNFDKWYNGSQWNLDKDIMIKNNKIYSPENCCLVPNNVNKLFIKSNSMRGELPIGVSKDRNSFKAICNNPFTHNYDYLGMHVTPFKAFLAYKKRKEAIIKQVAQIEYNKGNITKQCYDAMLKYEVEITD